MPPLKRTWTKKVRPILIDGDVAYVPLSRGLVAVIDAADILLVEGWNWTAERSKVGGTTYAVRGASIGGGRSKTVKMHQVIFAFAEGKLPDHKDGDGLNNRRQNLRPATHQQNTWNRRLSSANTSGFKGVCYRIDRGTWLASITVNGKRRKLGTFGDRVDAAMAYDAAASEMFGEFAVLNFPTKFDEVAA